MAVDLFKNGVDPWASIGGDLFGGASVAGSSPVGAVLGATNPWLSVGMQLLGGLMAGDTEISGAASVSQGALNTSGWVVGEGSAEGADLSASQSMASLQSLPWYVYAAGTLIVIAIIKKAV